MPKKDVVQVRDSRVLAAASHPLRRRLMDVLKVDGPATATMLAGHTEQAVANVSHHLKVLSGAGLVVEVPERARNKRERWWALASTALRWNNSDFADDPVGQAVASAAASLNLDRHTSLVRAWHAVSDERREWADAAFSTDKWFSMTPEDLAAFEGELQALVRKWATRTVTEDPRREPVFFFAHGVPGRP
ncbi:helix-turn-helix domain-containing protein [Virgisporangium ochraceum]|uniref:Transcriptional regulator n=1 Tax=Virgisporangium ochraceum TaxID=65505 RepID=A0A8J3ZPP4_9ACTN|nr:metalloregulator ArsR/SmtB family transcription factor [Virgisporangium ochraceum]GIJ66723.1 transcriptional regulator [Virgisporangium ochraceum]